MLLILLLAQLTSVEGFLLAGQSNKDTSASSQFLTKSEFMNEKQSLHSETESLRRDMDNSFAMLTSQLKQTLTAFETQISNMEWNVSANGEFVTVNKYQTLEKKYEDLLNFTHNLETQFWLLKEELLFEQNKTAHVEKDVVTLKNLETVKPVVEIESIKKSVEKNADAVHELQAKEQARNQDFLALFQKVTDLENRTQVLQHQMQESTEQVAMTAHPYYGYRYDNSGPVLFKQIPFSVGITNISSFNSTGKFVCEKPGLYLIAVTIASNIEFPEGCVLHNGHLISCMEIGQNTGRKWHSGSATVARRLTKGDEIWVQSYLHRLSSIEGTYWSHFTIIKIK